MADRYVLNKNEGVDIIHRNPRESCNTDDALDRVNVDADTADALLNMGSAVRCKHCMGDEK